MTHPWSDLPAALAGSKLEPWSEALAEQAAQTLAGHNHGDLSRWRAALENLPLAPDDYDPSQAAPVLGGPVPDQATLTETLMKLHPWRKGPLKLGGVFIDTEWHSDWKWDRVAPHVDLDGAHVLDIGCGNGYFGWRMLAAGARSVIGVDPTLVFVMQWLAQRHFAPGKPNFVLPFKDTDLPDDLAGFDAVFSMGVLYHKRQPAQHLEQLKQWLRPGGQLVLETLVIDQPGEHCLVPEGRYARMPNVWHLPSPDLLIHELQEVGFEGVELVDLNRTTTGEQRSTGWMRFESLRQCLDPSDPERTVEGYPAPVRAVVTVHR